MMEEGVSSAYLYHFQGNRATLFFTWDLYLKGIFITDFLGGNV